MFQGWIASIVLSLIYGPLPLSTVTTVQVLSISVCSDSYNFVLAAVSLILAVTQTLRPSLAFYKVTRKWQHNRYIQRLVKDGILYFFVYASLSFFLIHCHVSPCFSIDLYTKTDHSAKFFPLLRRLLWNMSWDLSASLMLFWDSLFTGLLYSMMPLFVINSSESCMTRIPAAASKMSTPDSACCCSRSIDHRIATVSETVFADVLLEDVYVIHGDRDEHGVSAEYSD